MPDSIDHYYVNRRNDALSAWSKVSPDLTVPNWVDTNPPANGADYQVFGVTTTGQTIDSVIANVSRQVSGTCLLQRMFGGTTTAASIQPYSITVDSNNNVIVAGLFLYGCDFGDGSIKTPNGGSNSDGFVAKYNPAGTLLWIKTIGQISVDGIMSVRVLSDGSVLVFGYSNMDIVAGSYDIGTGTTQASYGGADLFLVKISAAGAFVFTKVFGTNAGEGGKGNMWMELDSSDNIYLASAFAQGAGPGGQPVNDLNLEQLGGTSLAKATGIRSTCLIKLNSAAVHQWSIAIGGTGASAEVYPRGIAFDSNQNPILHMEWINSISAGGGAFTNSAKNDCLFAKYSKTNGAYIFQRRIGTGAGTVRGKGIASSPVDGSFIIIGEMAGTASSADFGDGIPTVGHPGGQTYLAKYTGANVFVSKYIFSTEDTPPSAMAVGVNSQGFIYFIGLATGFVDFGDGHFISGEQGGQDMFIMKRDPNNALVSVKLTGPQGEIGTCICFRNGDGNYLIGGSCGAVIKGSSGGLKTGASTIITIPTVYNNAWYCQFTP